VGYARNAALGNPPPTSLAAPAQPPIMRSLAESGRMLLETPAANGAMILSLTQDVGKLKQAMTDLLHETRQHNAPQVPEQLFEYYLQLIQNHVAEELAGDILKSIQRENRPEYLSQPNFVREKLA